MRRTVLDEPGAGRSRVPNAVVAGFTVLELLLVLAIAGIVTAVAVPNVDQAMKTYRGDFAARQVLTDLQATRMLALSRNVRYRMLLTANGNDLRPADAGPRHPGVRDRRDLYAAGADDLCGRPG